MPPRLSQFRNVQLNLPFQASTLYAPSGHEPQYTSN